MGEAKAKAEAAVESKIFSVEDVKPVYDAAFRASRTTISVIDAMCQRGAVKGEELSAIGQLRDQCVNLAQMAEAFHSDHE